jgi:hypothetical protein
MFLLTVTCNTASPATLHLLRTHNWPLLPRETATLSARTAPFSTAKSVSLISPSNLPEVSYDFKSKNVLSNLPEVSYDFKSKNIPPIADDALSSLLSFSPPPQRDIKEIKIYNERTEAAPTPGVCTGLDVSFLLNPSPMETEIISAVKITKSVNRRSIPRLKVRTPSSTILKENVDVKNEIGTGDREQLKNNSTKKNEKAPWTLENEKERLKSLKKLLIPSTVKDTEENSFPVRVLDMSEF